MTAIKLYARARVRASRMYVRVYPRLYDRREKTTRINYHVNVVSSDRQRKGWGGRQREGREGVLRRRHYACRSPRD